MHEPFHTEWDGNRQGFIIIPLGTGFRERISAMTDPKLEGLSVCAKRLHLLLAELDREGYSQDAIAELLDVPQSLVSKFRHPNSASRQDVKAGTIWKVTKRMRLTSEFFLGGGPDDVPGSYKLYSIEKAREAKKASELSKRIDDLERQNAKMAEDLAAVLARINAANASDSGRSGSR